MGRLRNLQPSGRTQLGLIATCLVAVVAYQSITLLRGPETVSSAQRKRNQTKAEPDQSYEPATQLATLKDSSINESSGLAASHTTPGVYWTHNDSGNGPFIHAFDERGNRRGVWRVTGAMARDWEDMAAGPGPVRNSHYLYIGDIGDNSDRRSEIIVYRIPEPAITAADGSSSRNKPLITQPAESFRFSYPEGARDAEALLVHPITGNVYIVTKTPFSNPEVYEGAAPLRSDITNVLVRIRELKIRSIFGGIITGGAISPDGKRVALCDLWQGYEIVLPDGQADFSSIWKQPIKPIALGKRKQGEAITYRLDGRALLVTSERLPTPLIQIVRR